MSCMSASLSPLRMYILFFSGVKCIKIGHICQNNLCNSEHTVSIFRKRMKADERTFKIFRTACGTQ